MEEVAEEEAMALEDGGAGSVDRWYTYSEWQVLDAATKENIRKEREKRRLSELSSDIKDYTKEESAASTAHTSQRTDQKKAKQK